MRLGELRQTFVVRLVMRLKSENGFKRIVRLDELSFEIRVERDTTKVVRLDA